MITTLVFLLVLNVIIATAESGVVVFIFGPHELKALENRIERRIEGV